MMPDLDNFPDGYFWGLTNHLSVWRMLRKSTDRQSWGMPWKDIEGNCRVTFAQIKERYSELVAVKQP